MTYKSNRNIFIATMLATVATSAAAGASEWSYAQAAQFNRALVDAGNNNDIDRLGRLLDIGVPVNNTLAANGTTPLMQAAMDGNVMLVKTLITRGADVNITDLRGENALKYAINSGNMDIAQVLVAHGADSSFLGAEQAGFLKYLDANAENWSSAYILPAGYKELYAGKTAASFDNNLVDAADKGDLAQVKNILQTGVNINSTGKYGTSPLMRAAYRGDNEMVNFLISSGAKINQADQAGMTPLALAQLGGHTSTAEILVKNGANKALYATFEQAAFPVALAAPAIVAGSAAGGASVATTAAIAGGAVAAAGAGVAISNSNSGSNDAAATPSCGKVTCAEKNSTGKGVTIAIIGNGVQKTGPYTDSAGHSVTYNFAVPNANNVTVWDNNSKDFLSPSSGVNDGTVEEPGTMSDHDTQTALVINQIAPDAKLLSIRAFRSDGYGIFPVELAAGITHAVDSGAKVINNSWGMPGLGEDAYNNIITNPDGTNLQFDMTYSGAESSANIALTIDRDEFDNPLPPEVNGSAIVSINHAIDQKVMLVWAAGNNGFANPNITAGLYLIHSEINAAEASKYWLVATAVKDNGDKSYDIAATGSNKCGLAKSRCIAAVAGNTSLAAAEVSAAVAKLVSVGGITTEQAGNRLLATATYLDETGHEVATAPAGQTNNIYGVGIMSKDLALSQLGSLFVNTGNQFSTLLSGSQIKLGGAFGDALAKENITFLAFDNNGNKNSAIGSAAFPVALSSMVSGNRSFDLDNSMDQFGSSGFANQVQFEGSQLQFSPYTSNDTIISPEQKTNNLGNFAYNISTKNSEYSFSHNVKMDKIFGFGAIEQLENSANIGNSVTKNPYLGFANESANFIAGHDIGKNFNVRFGTFSGKENDEINSFAADRKVHGSVGELNYGFGDTKLGLSAGQIVENGAFLGSETSGAFAASQDTPTNFFSLSFSNKVTNNLNLFGYYAQGTSTAKADATSLFSNITPISSNAYSLGISYDGLPIENSQIGFSVTQPLRITSGSASFAYDSGLDANGNAIKSTANLNLTPSARESDLETYYQQNISGNTTATASSMYRINPDHIANKENEGIFLLKLLHKF